MRRKKMFRKRFLLVLLFVILGTGCIFGERRWKAHIDRQDALHVEGEFAAYREYSHRGRVREHYLSLKDGTTIEVPQWSVDGRIRKRLNSLDSGTKLELLLHPDGLHPALEIRSGNEIIIDFEKTVLKMSNSRTDALIVGVLLYAGALFVLFIPPLVQKSLTGSTPGKRKNNRSSSQ